jgi:hypothetical protein
MLLIIRSEFQEGKIRELQRRVGQLEQQQRQEIRTK